MRKGHYLQKTIIRILIWGPIVYAVLLFWWTFTGAFEGVMSNGHSQTYAEYRQCDKVFEFDPIGASEISHLTVASIDGSDRWLTFKMSRSDYVSMVESISANEHGPKSLVWSDSSTPPQHWHPRYNPPTWWLEDNLSYAAESIYWCYAVPAREAGSYHRGWNFCREVDSNRVFCWHWRYQWAGDMCK